MKYEITNKRYDVIIWIDESPFPVADGEKYKVEKNADSKTQWYEGQICIEARLNPMVVSNYAMLCTKFVKRDKDIFSVEVTKADKQCRHESELIGCFQNTYNGLTLEFVENIICIFNDKYPENLPKGELTIFNGAYDVIGSSYRAFEKVIDILVIIYRNFEIKPFLTIIDVIKKYLQT